MSFKRTVSEVDHLEKGIDSFIEKVKQYPEYSAKTLGKQYRHLFAKTKRIGDRINKNLVLGDESSKKVWIGLSERQKKLLRKIDREWRPRATY